MPLTSPTVTPMRASRSCISRNCSCVAMCSPTTKRGPQGLTLPSIVLLHLSPYAGPDDAWTNDALLRDAPLFDESADVVWLKVEHVTQPHEAVGTLIVRCEPALSVGTPSLLPEITERQREYAAKETTLRGVGWCCVLGSNVLLLETLQSRFFSSAICSHGIRRCRYRVWNISSVTLSRSSLVSTRSCTTRRNLVSLSIRLSVRVLGQ